jgi:hypothetical protein
MLKILSSFGIISGSLSLKPRVGPVKLSQLLIKSTLLELHEDLW